MKQEHVLVWFDRTALQLYISANTVDMATGHKTYLSMI
jgi:hypothetical protein